MTTERQLLVATIAGLEVQRALLGDAIVDAALGPMRAKLATLPVAELEAAQALRQVTVLFMDVVGSTALSARLDPEDLSVVMDGTLARGTGIVETHRGKVLQYAGDNLLAVFGADEAREDDVEWAVRAGLALLALGRESAAEINRQYGWHGFSLRVGIHTGGVLLGGGVDGDGTIRGNTVNIAARMEQTAPAGGLRISHDTYAQVRGVFDVEPQTPMAIKGGAEPVQTYLVLRAKTRAFRTTTRGIEGVETRMIGRDAEFEALQAAFKRLFIEPGLAAVSIVGDAGLGKSRLIYEFADWSDTRPEPYVIFQGRATPETPNQPYGLLRDIIAWRYQIDDGDSMIAAKAKIEAGLMPVFETLSGAAEAEAHTHILGFLIGLDYGDSRHLSGIRDDQKQIRNRGFFAAAELLRGEAARQQAPIVLQLDDLHWADDPSLDFLFYLAQVAKDVPMLIIGLTRPPLFERRADWIGNASHIRIELMPFGKDRSRDLANELLKNLPEIPAALRELVIGGSDGNPFYMEELVKMLIDQGAITPGDIWALDPSRLLAAKVPTTLTGVLQARLDALPRKERLALQQASVIGMVFWDQALAALDAEAPAALPCLTRRDLALPQPDTTLANMREYAFKHQILHQVTVDTLLKRTRRELHAKAGNWFSGLNDARAPEFLGVAGHHFAEAGNGAKACEYFTLAAEHSRARFANDAALNWIARALALIDQVPAQRQAGLRWRLVSARERTFDLQGRRDEQAEDLVTLAALAEVSGDRTLGAEIACRESRRAARMGDAEAQAIAARRAMALAEAAGDVSWRLHAQRLLAGAMGPLGDVEAGIELAVAGLAEARRLGMRVIEGHFLNSLALLTEFQGDLVAMHGYMQQSLAINVETGDRLSELMGRTNLAGSSLRFGLLEDARRAVEGALSNARSLGDRYSEGLALSLLSEITIQQGEDTQALGHAAAALAISVEVQSRASGSQSLLALGGAELALGRTVAAGRSFARAADIARQIHQDLPDALAGLARVALAEGNPAAAVAHLEPVLAALIANGAADGEEQRALIRLTCWRALVAADDPRAPALLAIAYNQLQATAVRITDVGLRESFLANHPTNRAVVAAWDTLKTRQ